MARRAQCVDRSYSSSREFTQTGGGAELLGGNSNCACRVTQQKPQSQFV